jgi:surface protein
MFVNANAFNQNLNSWNTSKVNIMQNLFRNRFNNGQTAGLTGTTPLTWDTSNVTNMQNMFLNNTAFNQYISSWNTRKVTSMQNMFAGTTTAITPFNNGQDSTGVTAPMNIQLPSGVTSWTFNATPASINYRMNCRLTTANKPTSLP